MFFMHSKKINASQMKMPILVNCSFIHIPKLVRWFYSPITKENIDNYLKELVNTDLITLSIVLQYTPWLVRFAKEN